MLLVVSIFLEGEMPSIWSAAPFIFFAFVLFGVVVALYLMFGKENDRHSAKKH